MGDVNWQIQIDPWIIQDGNYPDFEAGQIAEFALEFDPRSLKPCQVQQPSVRSTGEARYTVEARVVAFDEREQDSSWVIDFGLLAYANGKPPEGTSVGDWVCGETLLSVDHYWYFEVAAKDQCMPELIYTWRLEEVIRETAPTRHAKLSGFGDIWEPDPERRTLEAVLRTDAWGDDQFGPPPDDEPPRYLSYQLTCVLQDVPRKRSSSTTT